MIIVIINAVIRLSGERYTHISNKNGVIQRTFDKSKRSCRHAIDRQPMGTAVRVTCLLMVSDCSVGKMVGPDLKVLAL